MLFFKIETIFKLMFANICLDLFAEFNLHERMQKCYLAVCYDASLSFDFFILSRTLTKN